MLKPKVWIETGIVFIYGANVDANYHSHVAMQIIWPKAGTHCILNEQSIRGLTLIDSKVEHCLNMQEGWILLIEPNSVLGTKLKNNLNNNSIVQLDGNFDDALGIQVKQEEVFSLLTPLCEKLNIGLQYFHKNPNTTLDKRIEKLLKQLELVFQTDCIAPDNWKAADVAKQLNLSEGRFLHLFTEQVGIAWRPFLLWKRMLCALKNMLNHVSATESAHIAGFSDSAHLSRTFKNTFGMTINQAKKLILRG